MADDTATRASLLFRIRNPSDQQSWCDFVDLYGPMIHRFAVRFQLQESDAADLVQEVLKAVHRSISKFEYNPDVGRFRSWLYRIAKNSISKLLKRSPVEERTVSNSEGETLLDSFPDKYDDLEHIWEREYQKSLFNWAVEKLRPQFQQTTWDAFWLSTIEERPIEEIATFLKMTAGSIYVARSRVKRAIATKIREIDDRE